MKRKRGIKVNASQAPIQEWRGILGALDQKTSEIRSRNRKVGGKWTIEPHREDVRWDLHLHRIVDEIALFIRGE